MGVLKHDIAKLLLFVFVYRALIRQIYIKLTKFTRRAKGPKGLMRKFVSGREFLKDMSSYNWNVVKRCRCCVTRLRADNVVSALVYGEKDIVDVFCALSLMTPIDLAILRETYELDKKLCWKAKPMETVRSSNQKIVVASLVNVEARIDRLRALGVNYERIILLDTQTMIV